VGPALLSPETVGREVKSTVGVAAAEAAELVAMEEGLGAALTAIPGRLGGRWNTRGKFTGSLSISPV